MKIVSWFHLNTILDKIKINRESPIYDLYIYHGCKEECRMDKYRTELIITIWRNKFMNGTPFYYELP